MSQTKGALLNNSKFERWRRVD